MGTPEDLGRFAPEIVSPKIEITVGEDKYTLTRDNTLVRKFLASEGQYDHLLHQMPNGKFLVIFFEADDCKQLKDRLNEELYPVGIDHILDTHTIEMYVRRQVSKLDSEII